MSGVGTSTLLDELMSRRLLTAGKDYEGWTASPGRVGEPHTNASLDAYPGVAVSRAVQKQGWFHDRVEGVLLSILIEVLVARVTTRTNSPVTIEIRGRRAHEMLAYSVRLSSKNPDPATMFHVKRSSSRLTDPELSSSEARCCYPISAKGRGGSCFRYWKVRSDAE